MDNGKRTIGLLVNDVPGVLMRVVGVFAKRGYNIESLVVSPGNLPRTSRMTITCSGPPNILRDIVQNLNKLVDVISAKDHTDDKAVTRELALFKVGCTGTARTEVLQIAGVFRADMVDISDETVTVEATGDSEKIDALETLLRPLGLIEMARTGKVVMARGSQTT